MQNATLIGNVLDLVGPLVGVVVGGLITYFVTAARDRVFWRRQRREKLSELERKAIGAAMEWIEPMRNAHLQASSVTVRALNGEISREAISKDWPRLHTELKSLDLCGMFQAVLPQDVYPRGNAIVRELEKLHYLTIRYGQEVEVSGRKLIGFNECNEAMGKIETNIHQLEQDLRAALRGSFG